MPAIDKAAPTICWRSLSSTAPTPRFLCCRCRRAFLENTSTIRTCISGGLPGPRQRRNPRHPLSLFWRTIANIFKLWNISCTRKRGERGRNSSNVLKPRLSAQTFHFFGHSDFLLPFWTLFCRKPDSQLPIAQESLFCVGFAAFAVSVALETARFPQAGQRRRKNTNQPTATFYTIRGRCRWPNARKPCRPGLLLCPLVRHGIPAIPLPPASRGCFF